MSNLYEQAIADAKNLRKMAEEAAKKRLVEAIMPQLQQIVDKDIMESFISEANDSTDFAESDCFEADEEDQDIESSQGSSSSNKKPKATTGATNNLLTDKKTSSNKPGKDEDNDGLTENESKALAFLIKSTSPSRKAELFERVKDIKNRINRAEVLRESVEPRGLNKKYARIFLQNFNSLLKEISKIRAEAIVISEMSGDNRLLEKSEKLTKEIMTMGNRLEKGVFARLFEAEGDGPDSGEDAPSVDRSAVDDLLAKLSDVLGVEVVAADEGDDDADDTDEGDDDTDEGDDDDNSDLDIDLENGSDANEDDLEEYGMHAHEAEADDDAANEVYEIDEAALARALRTLKEGDAASQAHHFGGAKVEGDVIVDLDEDDLLNALNDVLGREDVPMPKVESRLRYGNRSSRLSEGRQNRTLARQLAESRKSNEQMREHLEEMNLFNAKLLYANKLMQNKSLNQRQQRAIVEALDGAKTLREAKLLFNTLSASVVKRNSAPINESAAKVRGSASKSTSRSGAQTLTEGAGLDRWAILAGIQSKK